MPTKSVTCLQVDPMSLEWPVAPPAGSDQCSLSPSHEDPNDEHLEDALSAPPHLRWRSNALQPPQIQRGCLDRNTCVHIPDGGLRCVTWNTKGFIGPPTSSQLSRKQKYNYFSRLIENNNICLQEAHRKDEFLQAIQVLAPRFQLYGTFIPDNAKTPQLMRFYARCPGLIERLSIFLWLKRATSIATSMFLRTWRKDPYRAIMQLYV